MALLTIVFTDVVESSATKRDVSLGHDNRERDHEYLARVQTPHYTLIRACCQAHGGREVSTIGDAFYLTFEDPVEAIRCAADIQKKLAAEPIETPRGPLRLRIGIHSGFPELFEGSWHGTDVDTAARVESAAAPSQILISSRTYELVRQMSDFKFHPHGEFALKGVDRIALWEADWDGNGPKPTGALSLQSQMRQRRTPFLLTLGAIVLASAAVGYRIYATRKTVHARRSVAVLGFKNLGDPADAPLSTTLSTFFEDELAVSDQLRTIPGENVERAKTDLSLPDADSYSPDTLARLRKALGADEVVVGSYLKVGNEALGQIRLDLRAQDCVLGNTICAISETGAQGDLLAIVAKGGSDLREHLGVAPVTEKETEYVKAALPSDPEAATLYSEGLKKLRLFDAASARDLLQKAVDADPTHALAHSALAEAWHDLGYDEKAKMEAKKALDLSSHLSRNDRLLIEGRYRELNTEWQEAIAIYSSLWSAYPDNVEYGLLLAEAQNSAGKGQDSLASIEELRRKLPALERDDPRIDLAEATAERSLSDFKKEAAADESARKKAQAQGARILSAQAMLDQCWALENLGAPDQASEACQKAKEIFLAAGDRKQTARALTRLANMLNAQGHTDAALELYEQALQTMRETGSRPDTAGALANIGGVKADRGDTAGAQNNYEEALKIAIEDDDKQHALIYQNDLASVFYSAGDFAKAKQMYEDVIAKARAIGDQNNLASGLNNVGLILFLQGELASADQNLKEAFEIERTLGTKSDAAATLDALGDLSFARDDLEGAEKMYKESLEIRQQLGEKGAVASSKLCLAKLALERNQASQAQVLAGAAQQEFQAEKNLDNEIGAYDLLVRALIAEGKFQDAESALEQATKSPAQDSTVRLSLAITGARLRAREGKVVRAMRDLDEIIIEAKKMHLVGLEFEGRLAMAETEFRSRKTQLARTQLRTLEQEARQRGYTLISRKAAEAANGTTAPEF